jgi:hypothetical protein
LGTLETILDGLHIVNGHLGRHEFGLAEAKIGDIPPATPIPNITLLLSDIEAAFAVNPLPYVVINRIDMGNGEWRVQTIHRTFAGYSGFLLDMRAALELVMGGPERDFRLGLLKAEIS